MYSPGSWRHNILSRESYKCMFVPQIQLQDKNLWASWQWYPREMEGQSCYMTNLHVRLCITFLLPIFHWRMHGSRSRWSLHLLNTDLLSAYYVLGTVLNKHWGHSRDKQHKDSGSVASTAEDLHKKYNGAEGNTCEGRAHSSPGARKVLWEKWAAEKWRKVEDE